MSLLSSAVLPVLAGPFIGSFLGVVVVRLPQGRSIVVGRSSCDRCGATLGPFDLIPIVGWIALRGRCRTCGQAIDPLLPAIEILATVVPLWAASVFDSPGPLWVSTLLGWTLLCMAVIDARHLILPDTLTLPLVPAGLAVAWLLTPDRLDAHLIGAALGAASFWLLRAAYGRLRGREGLGLGDVKLAAAIGAWVAWDGLGSVVFLAAAIGISVVAVARMTGRDVRAVDRVPFGTYLCVGLWLVWLYGPLVIGGPSW